MALLPQPSTHRQRRRSLRRALGAAAVFALLAISGGTVASVTHAYVASDVRPYHVIDREKYQHAPGPITLVVRGLPPTSSSTGSGETPSADIKVIRVYASHIDLFAGGVRRRVINFNQPQVNLHDVTTLVADPTWISEAPGGHFTLNVALVAESRSHLVIAAPVVSDVLLVSKPSVLIGAQEGGSLIFDGVTVQSDKPALTHVRSEYRPAIVANGATMDITNSTFRYLGWDWNASYGVSWVNNASGKAVNSNFVYSFMGVYTSLSKSIQFIGGHYSHNILYGVDPHTSSSDLLVSGVTAEYNGAHGIIFSDNVNNSTIMDSTSRYNGENGIMMDQFSTNNRITRNRVEYNTGDGLVASNSGRNAWSNNLVHRNRVGIRLDRGDTTSVLNDNRIVGNKAASENVTLNATNSTRDNGGQWRVSVLKAIWTWTAMIYGGLVVATFIAVGIHRLRPTRLRAAPAM